MHAGQSLRTQPGSRNLDGPLIFPGYFKIFRLKISPARLLGFENFPNSLRQEEYTLREQEYSNRQEEYSLLEQEYTFREEDYCCQ